MTYGLTRSALVGYLRAIHQSQSPLYLHRSASNAYELFPDKRNRESRGETFTPLTYRQVILLTSTYKAGISRNNADRELVISELTRMREHKKKNTEKVWYIVSLVCSLWDQCQNWRQGYTWKSTPTLETELTKFLAKASATRAIAFPASPVSDATEISHLPSTIQQAPPEVINEEAPLLPETSEMPSREQEQEPQAMPIAEEPQSNPEPAIAPPQEPLANPALAIAPPQEPPANSAPAIAPPQEPVANPAPAIVPPQEPLANPAPAIAPPQEPVANPAPAIVESPSALQAEIIAPSFSVAIPAEQSIPIPTPTPEFLPTATPPVRTLRRRVTDADLYKANPASCRRMSKTALFGAVETIAPDPHGLRQRSFVNLLKDLAEVESPALDGICAQAVKDMYANGSKEAQDQLSIWLKTEPTMNAELFVGCLETLNAMHADSKPVSAFAIVELIKNYREKGWDQDLVTHSAFDQSMRILLEEAPNSDGVCELVRWVCGKPSFTQQMHNGWIAVLDSKERLHRTSLVNPARVILEEAHPEWKTERVTHQQSMPQLYKAKSMAEIVRDPNDNRANNISALHRTKAKKEALDLYKQSKESNGVSLTQRQISMIFREIKFAKAHPNPIQNREITSLQDLLYFVIDGPSINFEESICQSVVIDVIKNCEHTVGDAAVEWISGQETFGPSMLNCALEHYSGKYRQAPGSHLFGLEKLLSTYCDKGWADSSLLPATDPEIVEAVSILLEAKPNEASTAKIIDTLKPYFDSDAKQVFLEVFNEKERRHQQLRGAGAAPLHYAIAKAFA